MPKCGPIETTFKNNTMADKCPTWSAGRIFVDLYHLYKAAMETSNDLLSISTWDECTQDRWFQYNDNEWQSSRCDMHEYRRRIHQKYIDEYHYDNIPRLELLISDLDVQIRRRSKSAAAAIRTQPFHAEKLRLLRRRQGLELGWRRIADTMTRDSQKLFVLPKEIREKIFGYLYTRPSELEINFPDLDVRYSMLPRDPFLYLNADVVDPAIAAEAAQALYETNRFNIAAWYTAKFLRIDHFNSGIAPKDVIRILRMTMRGKIEFKSESNTKFESNTRFEHQRRDPSGHDSLSSDRAKLAVLLEMRQLQRVQLSLDLRWCAVPFEYREISPVIKMLHEQGVTVDVKAGKVLADQTTEVHDLSAIFINPTGQQKAEAKSDDKVGTIRTNIENMKRELSRRTRRSWLVLDLQCFEVGTLAQWRVHLSDHYEVFQSIETEEKRSLLIRARARLDAVAAGLACQKAKVAAA
ncbi:hypothetical protein BDV96DRAFT_598495 [Lophiotrema nucula]|uniref:Uncharacterized protein n=1 Tax=Lophiotrema nucula TaxID=690887 RepID=A0A6A5ZDU0_9PLEO|nr:hypothetical protein BDV96DRAFT_598495 [Lophiotrema nucula]